MSKNLKPFRLAYEFIPASSPAIAEIDSMIRDL